MVCEERSREGVAAVAGRRGVFEFGGGGRRGFWDRVPYVQVTVI